MAEQFISDAASWSKAFNLISTDIEEFVFEDEDKDILAFRIRYASGYQIVALSSKPRNLRSRQGRVVLDEAAFHDDLEGLLKAARALLMWGAEIHIISSVNGVDNAFTELCDSIEAGGHPGWSLHTITIDDALAEGLFQRICLVQGLDWSVELQQQWREQLFRDYGSDADEELLCIAATNSDPLFDADAIEQYATGCYQEPEKEHYYLAGLDPNMGGSDFWHISLWDLTTHPIQLVAEYHESYMLPGHCRKESLKLLDRYNVVLLAIEKNNGGLSQAEDFQKERPRLNVELVNTTHISKIMNTDRIANALTDGDVRYPKSSPLYSQMKKFSKKKREGVQSKDDAICSWMVAFAHLETALSLKPKKYHIESNINDINDRLSW